MDNKERFVEYSSGEREWIVSYMDRFRKYLKDVFIMTGVLLTSFMICLEMQKGLGTQHFIPTVFTVSVFITTLLTQGYLYGVMASLVSVLAVNYAFTFPYFKFNFTIRDNLLSAFIMLTVTLITSTLTTKIRIHEKLVADNEKEKLRSNLLRAISHDLRTPLTTIYGSSSAIVENYDKLSKEEQIELAQGIKQDSEWLIHMVENLLSVTRIDGEGVKLVKKSIVLDELIDSVLVKFRKRYPKQEVLFELPDDFILIQMDPVLIEQVLMNLMENAVKHAKGMSFLALQVTTDGEDVLFEVSDDGIGFLNKHIGIGLSVCESIIKAHGGKFFMKNRMGGGSVVGFSLQKEDSDE